MQVRFALLGSLVSSGRRREPGRSELLTGLMFSMLHLALGSVALAAPEEESAAAPLESVTYLDVPTPAEPASPRAQLKPRPVVVSQAVKIPAVEEVVSRPDKAAGFQELLTPREIDRLPPPDPDSRPVDERDFSGRGVAGGVAGGKPPTALPPDLAAALAAQEKITDILTRRRQPREIRPVEMTMVELKPQLLNRDEVLEWLLARWPPVLKEAGIEGSVVMQFVIDTLGRVRIGSARVISFTHPLFANAALDVIPRLQFTPGRMTMGGKLVVVPVNARVPFKWSQVE